MLSCPQSITVGKDMTKHIMIANYGNDSVALIQWAAEAQLLDAFVLSVATGWAAPHWTERVAQCQAWVRQCGFTPIQVKPAMDFTELMQTRGEFATAQFQWCAKYLKALPILDWLDETVDPCGQAIVMLATHSDHTSFSKPVSEWIEISEHFGERRLWQPLYQHTLSERDALIQRAGLTVLPHRSLECDPCVNSDTNDVMRLDDSVLARTAALEKQLCQPMLDPQIYQQQPDLWQAVQQLRQQGKQFIPMEQSGLFHAGCGNPFGCGM